MSTPAAGLPPALLHTAFPFHLVLDRQLRVLQAGASVRRLAPELTVGAALGDGLLVVSPSGPTTFETFRQSTRSLVQLATPGGLTLRGEMLHDEHSDVLFFLGSPYVRELAELADVGLTLEDFAVSDSAVDNLLLLQTQGHALAQAQALSRRLEQTAAALAHQVHHDALTGLPNRERFRQLLEAALAADPRSRRTAVGVLLLDLDGFKDVNDSLGHDMGDVVLQEVAQRVTSALRVGDEVARLGGDEFVVLLPAIDEAQDAVLVAKKIAARLAAPFSLGDVPLRLSASIGITLGTVGHGDDGTLLKQADVAMYRAKSFGCGWAVFDRDEDDIAAERLRLVSALQAAIDGDRLEVAYQPLLETRTGRITSFEALARWSDDELGTVAPDRFVPLAEQASLIVPLTRVVLRKAAQACAEWRSAGHDVGVAVNLSVRAIESADVVALVTEELAVAGLAPEHLTLEVTESSLATDGAFLIARLADLRATGVRVSIDDFGTGFSSMTYLRRLPVSELKIDRSFVRDLVFDAHDAAIVTSLVRLAHSLDLRVVAEGVEDEQTMAVLTRLGCDFCQGYGIARPMPAAAVLPWLASPAAVHAPLLVPKQRAARELLVVDDSRAVRGQLAALASEAGWQVRQAASAEEAIDQTQLRAPDVVVLDHHMTGMTGVAAVPVLRSHGFDGPILLFTQFLSEALPSMRVPLDVWPVAKSNPEAVMSLLDAYRTSLNS